VADSNLHIAPGGGGDFLSCQAWYDAQKSVSGIHTGNLDGSGDGGALLMAFPSTGSAYKLIAKSGSQHDLTDAGAPARISWVGSPNGGVQPHITNVTIKGIKFPHVGGSSDAFAIRTPTSIDFSGFTLEDNLIVNTDATTFRINNILMRSDTGINITGIRIVNNMVVLLDYNGNANTDGIRLYQGMSSFSFDVDELSHNILIANGTVSNTRVGLWLSANVDVLQGHNNFSDGWSTANQDYLITANSSFTGTKNASGDSTALGTSPLTSIDRADQFENILNDWRIKESGTDLRDAGADRLATVPFDALGNARSTPVDIGWHEYGAEISLHPCPDPYTAILTDPNYDVISC